MQEEADQVPHLGANLLADDDHQARRVRRCPGLRLERAIDAVVVGDRQVGQAAGGRRADDGAGRGERVEAGRRVAMQVDEGLRGVASVLGDLLADARAQRRAP
ncbi:MAG TPA: hypothetical protein VMQ65_09190 [Candidatus Limnocylindria bacterium]|nr:hypothetical protein [Candidatus Limnocylindria bacterium]